MKKWLILAVAIAMEVTATLALRAAIDAPWWAVVTVVCYVGAFLSLATLLRMGEPIGLIYGIWAASGVAATALLASVIFGEPVTPTVAVGIAVVVAGVFLVETGHSPRGGSGRVDA